MITLCLQCFIHYLVCSCFGISYSQKCYLLCSFIQTLALLASFQTKLNESEEKEEEDIDDNEAENEDDDTGW